MKRNFTLKKGVEIHVGENFYDLHNCYNLCKLSFCDGGNLEIEFMPHPEWGVGKPPLILSFKGVSVFEVCQDFSNPEIVTVDEMGFKSPNDRDYDWLLEEYQSKDGDHFVIRFGDSNELRVFAENVVVSPS